MLLHTSTQKLQTEQRLPATQRHQAELALLVILAEIGHVWVAPLPIGLPSWYNLQSPDAFWKSLLQALMQPGFKCTPGVPLHKELSVSSKKKQEVLLSCLWSFTRRSSHPAASAAAGPLRVPAAGYKREETWGPHAW